MSATRYSPAHARSAAHVKARAHALALAAVLAMAAALVAGLAMADTARAAVAPAPSTSWVTDASVEAIAHHDNTTYIGGSFTYVGPRNGGFARIDGVSALRDAAMPDIAGTVSDVVLDGAGGWYVGGTFSWAGGQPRSNVAHVLS
jgi:hypothetical protein